jgi:AraC-like DNA-binding protein
MRLDDCTIRSMLRGPCLITAGWPCLTGQVNDPLPELCQRIARLAGRNSSPSWVGELTVFSAHRVTEPLGTVTQPMLALVAQGAKRSALADRLFEYHAGQYLVVAVELPLTSQITRATAAEPFLALGLPLDPTLIAQLLLEAGPAARQPHAGPAIAVSDANGELLDAVVRLLRLIDSPRDFQVLAPGVQREIHWRLLDGPQGALLGQIGLADSRLAIIARAISWIHARYDQAIRIDDLAHDIGMSVSSLNRQFRAVTAMSPLQYQKQLRLQQARIQLIGAPQDVAAIGHAVGYGSPSQFSREYRRMFGTPPGRDIARLQAMATIEK